MSTRRTTSGGFRVYGTIRTERVTLRVHESSAAGPPRVWLFLDAPCVDHQAAHLSTTEARHVAKALLAFAGERNRRWGKRTTKRRSS